MALQGSRAKDAQKEKTGMADTLVERAWAWLHATFPERQVYIRSDGRVQFFTFGPTLQATFAGLALIFLGWVAFASVNVIFKDRIIAAKDHRYQQMQATYENRVADQQIAYDELNASLVSAEDHFKATADELGRKQATVAKLLNQKQAVDQTLAGLNTGGIAAAVKNGGFDDDTAVAPGAGSETAAGDGLGADEPMPVSAGDEGVVLTGNGSQLGVMAEPVQPQPRTGRPAKASLIFDNPVTRFATFLFQPKPVRPVSVKLTDTPALRVLAEQTARIERMSSQETAMLEGVDQQVTGRVGHLQGVLRRVGVNPDVLERQASNQALGGPLLPVNAFHIDGIADQRFAGAYAGASAHVKELDSLFTALRHVPLTTPVHGQQFELTSPFGARVDPFTHNVAFHSGVDFGGPWGSVVGATAPGVVIWAGQKGGYGNMVEIDHGYGFHTRYGHLSSILVRVGSRVEKGSPIGKLGSTGRSTGPHVHYEVWLADVVRDPSRFIEAGRHVSQQ
jgi:murein DD-endopeptidase MepM/ murein hydrolase activator NlpD